MSLDQRSLVLAAISLVVVLVSLAEASRFKVITPIAPMASGNAESVPEPVRAQGGYARYQPGPAIKQLAAFQRMAGKRRPRPSNAAANEDDEFDLVAEKRYGRPAEFDVVDAYGLMHVRR